MPPYNLNENFNSMNNPNFPQSFNNIFDKNVKIADWREQTSLPKNTRPYQVPFKSNFPDSPEFPEMKPLKHVIKRDSEVYVAETKDDMPMPNSDLSSPVSELEKIIEMIEKADTQLSSLIGANGSFITNFKQKVSMMSDQIKNTFY